MVRANLRAKKRGAAMVEAIVIMCTMLVFFGMNLWAFRVYGGKLDQMSSTRRDALYYASHNCEKKLGTDPDDYTVPQLRGNDASGGSTMDLMGIIDVLRGRERFDFFGTSRSEKGPIAIAGTATAEAGADHVTIARLQGTVKTKSAVGCNEKPLGDGALALLNMGWQFIKGLFN
jgi:hypothetical protein